MSGQSLLWFGLALFFLGMVAGLILGVVIDRDKVVHQIFKKLKIKRGTGDIVVDVEEPDLEEKKKRRGLFRRNK